MKLLFRCLTRANIASLTSRCLLWLCVAVLTPMAHAQQAWLPNVIHLINEPVLTSETQIHAPAKSESGNVRVYWTHFSDQGYTLEYKLNDTPWQTLYSGHSAEYIPNTPLTPGQYTFRLHCNGLASCPQEGYLVASTAVVTPPTFINSYFEQKSSRVALQWEDKGVPQGHVVEQSADEGQTWQIVEPEETLTYHTSNDYEGALHTGSETSVNLNNQLVPQSTLRTARATSVTQYLKRSNASLDLKYRVKRCVQSACGTTRTSKSLSVRGLTPILPDQGFESGSTQFFVSEGGGFSEISNRDPINGSHSLNVTLQNWGYLELYYPLGNTTRMNGFTIKGLLNLRSLSAGNTLSIYAAAYYLNGDIRIEGSRTVVSEADLEKTISAFSTLYLDESEPIKFVRYYIRLIGEGTAEFTLDDAQMYKGTHVGQDVPVLTSWLSSYTGHNKLSWTPFKREGQQYTLEYTKLHAGSNTWKTLYKGTQLAFDSALVKPAGFPLSSGQYRFRIACGTLPECPTGYQYADLIVSRTPDWVSANYNPDTRRFGIAWSKTVAAKGYLVEQNINGTGWRAFSPDSNDNSLHYKGYHLFAQTHKVIENPSIATYQFRVKACRSSGCEGLWITSNPITLSNQRPDLWFYAPISTYFTYADLSWSEFKPANQPYHVETRQTGQNWKTLYSGSNTEYRANLPAGMHIFRLHCAGHASCPASGYLEQHAEIVPSPLSLDVQFDKNRFMASLSWTPVTSAYGYVIEHRFNQTEWRELTPQASEGAFNFVDPQTKTYHTLFTGLNTTLPLNVAGVHDFRVKACRSSQCGSYVQANLLIDMKGLIQWEPDKIKVTEPSSIVWDASYFQHCHIASADDTLLHIDESGQTRVYSTGEPLLTEWQCQKMDGSRVNIFAPISVQKLTKPDLTHSKTEQ
ncbi:hypothetical protein OE749_08070 [Aestuariibacter sp. AA17]|uniref:Fibronectin type-III domain-containing protein n=1 Tax=Fluctibacter corallii TaxID=2984329 RepID=A0ABT3A7V2_9ALTE|nr:hypothetical protein [Aestuariibacter sp. AA17]MCV2884649.1 hypothetical protein [Aestuariibacter sp. AA17]